MDEKVTGVSVNNACKKVVWVRELLSKLIKVQRAFVNTVTLYSFQPKYKKKGALIHMWVWREKWCLVVELRGRSAG